MKLYRFDVQAGKSIIRYDSKHLIFSRIVRTSAEAHIGCMHLGPNGVVGYHQAVVPQLFLVVQGEGWVRGEEEERTPLHAGQAAFWQAGEWHESGTETGMMAIVIESEELDPSSFMTAWVKHPSPLISLAFIAKDIPDLGILPDGEIGENNNAPPVQRLKRERDLDGTQHLLHPLLLAPGDGVIERLVHVTTLLSKGLAARQLKKVGYS